MIRVLFILQSAFSMWMFFDAIQHRRASYWYFIIMLPFGEVVYFFMVKIHDPDMRQFKQVFNRVFALQRPPSLDALRYQLRQTPCLANMVTLGQGLHDAGEYAEGAELFSQALERDPESRPALLGLGACRIGLEEYEPAVVSLERLIELEPGYSNFEGWSMLAFARWQLEQRDEAVETLQRLVATSPRMAHRLALARYLAEADRNDEARSQVATALEDYKHAPKYQRRNDRGWAREANKMLRQLSTPTARAPG